MKREQYFIDTSFVLATVNKKDKYHKQANEWLSIMNNKKFWISEAILLEIGNSLSRLNKKTASIFIRSCYKLENVNVIKVTTTMIQKALDMYDGYPDKDWGLVDCISFLIMKKNNIRKVLTTDKHFLQAGSEVCLETQ